MCTDRQGDLWVGTEGAGIQRFEPSATKWHEWTQFTTKDGLGDDNGYAIACDHRGRIWAGHVNHGVSVFNGSKWQNYDAVGGVGLADSLSGPLGERVFAIAVCPKDGDVWIATNAGLTRYSDSKDTWSYYTRADGLPSNEANAIAFDSNGNIYLGTQCDGIAIASATDGYSHWRKVRGSDKLGLDPNGAGLPTNLINDLLVTGDGTVYAGTPSGLAWSNDLGASWRYVRGKDWAQKVKDSAAGSPVGWTERPGAPLAEDYIVRLGEDTDGKLYVGYRYAGWECFHRRDDGWPVLEGGSAARYVTAFSSPVDRYSVVGTYYSGLVCIGPSTVQGTQTKSGGTPASLPTGAPFPDLAALNRMLAEMATVAPLEKTKTPLVLPLEDDWRTEGDWLGRYGRYWAVLAAIDAYDDYVWGAGPEHIQYARVLGPHHTEGDGLRRWLDDLYTDDRRVLEMPPVYMDSRLKHGYIANRETNRRSGQWDDHGESYSTTYEGPDIYFTLAVPEGLFILSAYDVNFNAHWVPGRDFKIVVKAHGNSSFSDITGFDALPELASARIQNFWYGVYKRFLVQGPVNLTIKVSRQYSLNTHIVGIMLDLPDERPAPYFAPFEKWKDDQTNKAEKNAAMLAEWKSDPQNRLRYFNPASSPGEASSRLLEQLDEIRDWNPRWWAIHSRSMGTLQARRFYAQPSAKEAADEIATKATSLYDAGLYEEWEKCLALTNERPARQIEKSLTWDGITPAYSGHGLETVRSLLTSETRRAN